MTKAVGESYHSGHAVVPHQSEFLTIIEEPDEPTLTHSSCIPPPEKSADQSKLEEECRRTSESDLDRSRCIISSGTAVAKLMGLETSRDSPDSDTRSYVYDSTSVLQDGEPNAGTRREQILPIHETNDGTTHTPYTLNSLGSNDQGVDLAVSGDNSPATEELSSEESTQTYACEPTGTGIEGGQPLSREAETDMRGVPCDSSTSKRMQTNPET